MEEDKEMYQEFLNGNQEAFDRLMEKYQAKLIYFIQRYVGAVDIAEDLAQDVFVYILMNPKQYDFKYSLKTYLYMIAKSRALNYLKREKRIIPLNETIIYTDDKELEDQVFSKEKSQNLKKAIDTLPLHYQTAIYLADMEELSYKEIADIMEISLSQVRVLIHRARKKLTQIVKKEVEIYAE